MTLPLKSGPESCKAKTSRFDIKAAIAGGSYVALVAVSIIPAFLVRFPESADYLNHLGRAFVLTVPSAHPVHAFYRPEWHLVPNLGLDILVLGLAQMMSTESAMKLAWMITVVSLPSAFWFLHWAIHRRTSPSLLISALCLFNYPLTLGILGFSLGLAAALATVGLWFRLDERVTIRNVIILNAASTVILIMHAVAVAALGLTIVALHALRAPWRPAAVMGRALIVSCGFLAPFLTLMCMEGGASGQVTFDLLNKYLLFFRPVFTGIPVADAISLSALLIGLFLLLRVAGGRCDRRLVPTLVMWAVALFVMPSEIGRATSIDGRLVLFPTLLLLASLDVPSMRMQWIAGGVAGAAVCVRLALMIPEWQEYNRAIDGFHTLEEAVEPGAKVVIAEAPLRAGKCDERRRWPQFYHHIPVLLLIERNAYVPTLFSAPGMQPIRVAQRYQEIAGLGVPIIPWQFLLLADTPEGRTQIRTHFPKPWLPYFLEWRETFDYLLVLSLPCSIDISSDDGLLPLGESGFYRLYRIARAQR